MAPAEDARAPGPEGGTPARPEKDSLLAVSATPDAGGSTAPPTTFAPGQLVADRFRIVRFIARGGMGEVYEAEDSLLRISVALKTIRPQITAFDEVAERFKREILFARRVTHPNVCRTFDVFRHRVAGDPGGAHVTFLTMELLPGETLAERLRRTGRMAPAEAFPIVAQMVAALSAAHRAGVVHRDLKSANVMLAPSSGGLRVVITDFGLAREVSTSELSSTGTGAMLGTSAYMAPEQVAGGIITPAADIYALGVVTYEMVTGAKPFVGDSALAVAVKRMSEPPVPPRAHVSDLDPGWESTILRCLERQPSERFTDVDDFLKALSGEGRLKAPEAVPGRPGRGRKIRLAGIAAALLVALAVATRLPVGRPPEVPAPPAPLGGIHPRRAVAVLGFKNLSRRPDKAWLSTALAEMLGTELTVGERLRLIPGEDVARMKIDLSLADADSLGPGTLGRIRGHLGADLVVLGSYLAMNPEPGGPIRLDLRIQDAEAGVTVASAAQSGTEGEVLDLVSRTGAWLRERLGVQGGANLEARASLPSNPEAARLYAAGLEKLWLFDAPAGRDLLERALAADPDHPLIHLALSHAWSDLGFDERSRDEARKAFEASPKLSREGRLRIEGRFRETAHEWEKALEIYRILRGFFPDNVEYGLRLATIQMRSGKGIEALSTLEALRRLPSPAGDHPVIDVTEAAIAQSLADFKRQQAAAARAVAKGTAQGARLLVAEARRWEGWAFFRLGEPEKARAALEDARRTFASTGDRRGVALALSATGALLRMQGDLGEAAKAHEEALAIFRESGDMKGVASSLNSVGTLLAIQGEWERARKCYGDAVAIERDLRDRRGEGQSLIKLADLHALDGDLGAARRTYEEALEISRETNETSFSAYALSRLGKVSFQQGDLAAARLKHEESLRIRSDLGEKGTVAESRLALAGLALEQGRLADAERLAGASAREFRKEGMRDLEAETDALLAEALVGQARHAEARGAMERALLLSERSQRPQTRLSVTIAAARVRGALGDASEARASLETALVAATRARLVDLQFDARLALGQIEIASGPAGSGRARLGALEQDATAKGFGLVARKAAAARRP